MVRRTSRRGLGYLNCQTTKARSPNGNRSFSRGRCRAYVRKAWIFYRCVERSRHRVRCPAWLFISLYPSPALSPHFPRPCAAAGFVRVHTSGSHHVQKSARTSLFRRPRSDAHLIRSRPSRVCAARRLCWGVREGASRNWRGCACVCACVCACLACARARAVWCACVLCECAPRLLGNASIQPRGISSTASRFRTRLRPIPAS